MCGYCTETLAIDIMDAACAGILHADVAAGSPLALEMAAQEVDPALALDHRPLGSAQWPTALTLQCRRVEALLAEGASAAHEAPASGHPVFKRWTVPAGLPNHRDVEAAAVVLQDFARWWPRQNPDADAPDAWGWSAAKMEKTQELEAILPELWAAQAIAFHQPLSEHVVKTAQALVLMALPFTPDMPARDLWLQRRAMMAWHAHAGDLAIHRAEAAGMRAELVRYVRTRQRPMR